jgi:hypothetical protein
MELQELVERIQRWRARQGLPTATSAEQLSFPMAAAAVQAEPVEEAVPAESAEEQISELDVEPDAVVAEEQTSEVSLEQIEETD